MSGLHRIFWSNPSPSNDSSSLAHIPNCCSLTRHDCPIHLPIPRRRAPLKPLNPQLCRNTQVAYAGYDVRVRINKLCCLVRFCVPGYPPFPLCHLPTLFVTSSPTRASLLALPSFFILFLQTLLLLPPPSPPFSTHFCSGQVPVPRLLHSYRIVLRRAGSVLATYPPTWRNTRRHTSLAPAKLTLRRLD